jgi:hypothetical protein
VERRNMSSTVKDSNSSLMDKELRPHAKEKTIDENDQLTRILDNILLKDVPIEERRKEAKKPLFLTRYELAILPSNRRRSSFIFPLRFSPSVICPRASSLDQ